MEKQRNNSSSNQAILVKRKWLKVISLVDMAMYSVMDSKSSNTMKISQ